MKRKHLSEEQIAIALRQHKSGIPVSETVRTMKVSEQTIYR